MQSSLTTHQPAPKTILVIDDVASLREEIAATLECLDFQVITAENGAAGIRLAHAHAPELIICDIMMPEMDGYSVQAALHGHPDTASIPFIFLSAKADRSDIRRGMNLGADDYLTKPFTSEELGETIIARLTKREAITQPYLAQIQRASTSLTNLAYTDPLTQLPNRIALYHQLQEKLTQAGCAQEGDGLKPMIALLCLGFKQFEKVGLRLDEVAMDRLLQHMAERIKLLADEKTIVARLGQAEFALVISSYQKVTQVKEFAIALLESLTQSYSLAGHNLHLNPHVGISLYPAHGTTVDQLLTAASLALGHIQQTDQSNLQFFNAEIERSPQQQHLMGTNLGEILKQTEFELYYQPQINLLTGQIIGAEALLRCSHPDLGQVQPETFVPLVEATKHGNIVMDWVMQQVCLQQQAWQKLTSIPMLISVHLSARQLYNIGLVERISAILAETGCNPELLCLDVAETAVTEDFGTVVEIFKTLKTIGFRISIHDFGTGQMPLISLHSLPIDFLKIHQRLITPPPDRVDHGNLMTSLLTLANALNFQVIVQGVEHQQQVEFLRELGCHGLQGNIFSPAISIDRFERLLVSDYRLG